MPHQRRRSGHNSANNSTTDVRKSATASDSSSKHKRPQMSRKHTPVSGQKLGRSQRERERDREWFESWDDERESFPQYCMTCEKQFMPYDDKFLYCSETCRRMDQNSQSQATSWSRTYSASNYPFYSASEPEPKDIIPSATPSRPNSLLFGHSPPATPGTHSHQHHQQHHHHSSAMSALRSLTTAPLPSPPSPTGSSLWPFTRSAATSPGSYTLHGRSGGGGGGFFSSTYDGAAAYPKSSAPPPRYSGHGRPRTIEVAAPR